MLRELVHDFLIFAQYNELIRAAYLGFPLNFISFLTVQHTSYPPPPPSPPAPSPCGQTGSSAAAPSPSQPQPTIIRKLEFQKPKS